MVKRSENHIRYIHLLVINSFHTDFFISHRNILHVLTKLVAVFIVFAQVGPNVLTLKELNF